MLFESQGIFTVNGEVRLYQRKVDTSSLVNGMRYMNELTLLYKELCSNIERQVEWDRDHHISGDELFKTLKRYQISVTEHKIAEASKVCKDMGGTRPAVMNKAERAELSRFMIEHGVEWVPADIEYSSFDGRYVIRNSGITINPDSITGHDIVSAFPKVHYGGKYTYYTATGYGRDEYIAAEKVYHNFIYVDPQNLKFALAYTSQMKETSNIVCEIPPQQIKYTNASIDPIYLMAYKNCLREIKGTLDGSNAITEEAQMITRMNMILSDAKALEDFTLKIKQTPIEKLQRLPQTTSGIGEPKIQSTRFNPKSIIEEVKAWSENLNGKWQANSWSPLAFLGKAFGPVFGLMSESARPTQGLIKSAQAIGQLAINQQQIAGAIEQVTSRLEAAMEIVYNFQSATLTAMTEADVRLSLKFFQNIMLDTLSRYVDIIQQAAVHKTSLYALNEMDILKYVKPTLNQDQWIPVSVEQIKSTIAPNNESLLVLYDIPVTSTQEQFTIFRVTPIPVYTNDSKLMPELEFNHFAWGKKGEKYIPLTADEYQNCVAKPLECTAHSPVMSTNAENTACVIDTHMHSTLKCPMRRMPTNDGMFFQRHGNTVYYSVEKPTRVYINCEAGEESLAAKEMSQELTAGFGKLTMTEACSIVIPRRGSLKTIVPRERVQLGDSKAFQMASFRPTITNISAELPAVLLEKEPPLNLTTMVLPSPNEILTDTLHPKKSIPFLVSIFILGSIVLFIFLFFKYCKSGTATGVTKFKAFAKERAEIRRKKLTMWEVLANKFHPNHEAQADQTLNPEKARDVEQPLGNEFDDMMNELKHAKAYVEAHYSETSKTSGKGRSKAKLDRATLANEDDISTVSSDSENYPPPKYQFRRQK